MVGAASKQIWGKQGSLSIEGNTFAHWFYSNFSHIDFFIYEQECFGELG